MRLREAPKSGFAELGRGVADIGSVVNQVRQEERAKADRAAVTEADRLLGENENELLFDPQNGAFTKRGKDAFALPQAVLPEYDKRAAKIAEGLSTDRQKTVFREALNERRQGVERGLNRHEAGEREQFYADERKSYKEQAQSSALSYYKDPARIETEVSRIGSVIDQTPGMSAEQKATELGMRRSNVYAGVVDRFLANDDLKPAESYYASVKDRVNGEQAANIERAIRITRDRLDAKRESGLALAKADLQSRIADIRVAAQLGLPVDEIPSRALFVALYGENGAAMHERVQKYADLSADTAKLNQLSNDQIASVADGYTPRKVEGAAEQAELSGFAATAAKRILDARKADPAQYLIDTSPTVSSAWQALQGGGEGVPSQYFNAVEAEKDRLGIVSPEVLPKDAQPGSNAWQQVALLATNKYRQLPAQASKWADGALRSNDPKVVAQAASLLDAVDNVAPGSFHNVSTESKTKGAMVAAMLNAGADPERAVQTVTDAMKVQGNVVTARASQYRTEQKGNAAALNSNIDRDFDPGLFYGQPATSAALSADYDRQVGSYYKATGDIDISRALAWSDLRRVYGPTRVNGQHVMAAFPVERFGIRPEEIRKEIGDLLAGSAQADGSKPEDITLVADSDTLRSVDDAMSGRRVQPTYRLVTKTGDLVRLKDGTPVRYSLPDNAQLLKRMLDEQKKARDEGESSIQQAKFDRQQRLLREQMLRAGELR